MSDQAFDTLQLLGRQVKDVSIEKDERGQPYPVDLPGNYEVGVEVGNQFVTLAVFKAGNILNADGSAVRDAPTPAESAGDSSAGT